MACIQKWLVHTEPLRVLAEGNGFHACSTCFYELPAGDLNVAYVRRVCMNPK